MTAACAFERGEKLAKYCSPGSCRLEAQCDCILPDCNLQYIERSRI